ncbi:unnamed protein product [Diamesa tonsa]
MQFFTDVLCNHAISRIINCTIQCWIMLLIIGFPSKNNGLSSLTNENGMMTNKLFYLLSPHIAGVVSENVKLEMTNSTSSTVNIVDSSEFKEQQTVNQNLYDNQNIDNIALINTDDENYFELFRTPMKFGTENSTIVTTQIGAIAHIPCTIHHIGEGVVSWIRRKDYHLLTVGLTTYSSDERFCATHLKNSEDWTLQIKYVQKRDAGQYECQVSTHPPTSIFLELNVVEARAEIVGPTLKYLTPGSTLRLICKVLQSTEATAFIFWYHDNRMINYDLDRGINVTSEADFRYSELSIMHATKQNSGNYTCVPSNSQPASVMVHIFKGDVAAMYHEHRSGCAAIYINRDNLLVTQLFILSTMIIKVFS